MAEMELRGDGRIASKEFETVWAFDAGPGRASFRVQAETADFTVDWGDGVSVRYVGLSAQDGGDVQVGHDYEGPGEVRIRIRGCADNWHICASSARNLRAVRSFGPVGLGAAAFKGCTFLTKFSGMDVPDSRKLVNMSEFLRDADNFDDDLEKWDVSHVTDMHGAFKGALKFNHPLEKWDVSHVTDMRGMFCCTEMFNQPLEGWDVSHVRYMDEMFMDSYAFDQPLGGWDVSGVESMCGMFCGAFLFNRALGAWDVSHVKHMDEMFMQSMQFNHPLERWDVSQVETMDRMFRESKFNQPLGAWDISNVRSMRGFVVDAPKFRQVIESWGWNPEVLGDETP